MGKRSGKRKRESSQVRSEHKIQRCHKEKFEIVERVKSQGGIMGQIILWYGSNDQTPLAVLSNAINVINGTLDIRSPYNYCNEKSSSTFALHINNEVIVEGSYASGSEAKRCLAELALKELKKSCFSIYQKRSKSDSPVVDFKKSEATAKFGHQPAVGGIGAQMLLKMGWTGGGLGAKEQGITEIIKPTHHVERQGFGNTFRIGEIRTVLENYAASDDINSLSFPSNFTKEERAHIHSMARKMNLKSTSYGSKDRRLVLQKKWNYWQIIDALLEMGGENDQYQLVLPTLFDLNK